MSEQDSSQQNKYSHTRRTFLAASGAVGLLALAGKAQAQQDKLVYAYVNWGDSVAASLVGINLISEYFGYQVEPLEVDVAVAYTALQSGQADCYSTVYLSGQTALTGGEIKGGHADYVNKIKDSIDFLGVSWGPIGQGIAVPEYVSIKSIEELNANSDKFGGQIVGIDAGSGLMQAADTAVKDYGLNLRLVAGSQAAMEAAFKRAYQREEWVAVTTWDPLPMWARYKMRYLEDPKKILAPEPFFCFNVARKGFEERFPKAHAFLKKYQMPGDQLSLIMAEVDNGAAPNDAAKKWIADNKGKGLMEKWVS